MTEFVEIIGRDGKRRRARRGECLADGERFSLPMTFMDSALRDALVEKYGGDVIRVVDAAGRQAGHRPGFLFDRNNALADSACDEPYRKRLERLDARNRRAGLDDDDEDGDDGRRQEMDERQMTLDELQARAESEYQKRCARMREAWRTKS
jgi:hypothetical protein